MNPSQFKRVVADALEHLPDEFLHVLENVAIIIEAEPSLEDFAEVDADPNEDELFGVYHGVPLTERSFEQLELPNRVVIFREPLLRCFDDPEDLEEEIRRTVIHELGHHMGLSDEEMPY
jgi:predicted Zn-dependent protease with MMP-like domain